MAIGSKSSDDLEKKLKSPKFAAHYLASAIEENDDDFLSEALATVVNVHGPSQLAENSGISRQALHKMLSTLDSSMAAMILIWLPPLIIGP